MLEGHARQQFEMLHATGMAAKNAGDHERALAAFEAADQLAEINSDEKKRLDALQPAARALWNLEEYGKASNKLETAAEIARRLELLDEQGIIVSNLGRIAAVKTIKTVAIGYQKETLKSEAVPHFNNARTMLNGHPHLYFRYANAQHGSVVCALAGERRTALRLIKEGLSVAFQKSPEPYDQRRTYEVNPKGLVHFLAAAALLPFGNATPTLAKRVRSSLVH